MSKGEVRLGCCPTGECFDHPALLAEIERLTAVLRLAYEDTYAEDAPEMEPAKTIRQALRLEQ
jgi:hypothetical protein